MSSVSSNIRKIRMRLGMTQEELAQKLHVTRQTVSNWETGRNQPDIDMLKSLAETFDTDAGELIYGIRPKPYVCYQKRFVVTACICGGIILLSFLLSLTLQPLLDNYASTYYNPTPLLVYNCAVYPATIFSLGMLLPALVSFWTKTAHSRRRRIILLTVGVVLLIPAVLVLVQAIWYAIDNNCPQFIINKLWFAIASPFQRMNIFSVFIQNVILYFTAFSSGICISLGTNKDKETE